MVGRSMRCRSGRSCKALERLAVEQKYECVEHRRAIVRRAIVKVRPKRNLIVSVGFASAVNILREKRKVDSIGV